MEKEKSKVISNIKALAKELVERSKAIDMNYDEDIDILEMEIGDEFWPHPGAKNVYARCVEKDSKNTTIVLEVHYQGESWIDKHFHNYQTEVIRVMEGEIYDDVTELTIKAGDIYFINKRESHHIKSEAGARLMVHFCTKYSKIGEFIAKKYL